MGRYEIRSQLGVGGMGEVYLAHDTQLEGGAPIKVLDPPVSARLRWMPDGRALCYIDIRKGVSNLWRLPLDGGPPKQITDFKTDQIFQFDWSRDGRWLALARGSVTSDVVLVKDSK